MKAEKKDRERAADREISVLPRLAIPRSGFRTRRGEHPKSNTTAWFGGGYKWRLLIIVRNRAHFGNDVVLGNGLVDGFEVRGGVLA